MPLAEEYEIATMFFMWSAACLTPLLPVVWFLLPLPRIASAVLAGLIVLSCTWPCGDWPVPPKRRWQMCVPCRPTFVLLPASSLPPTQTPAYDEHPPRRLALNRLGVVSRRPLRNQQTCSAFLRYFPMRCILESEGAVLHEDRPMILAGVPHGLFPIGMLCLSLANCMLPFRWTRGAAASITLRLPIWRQVLGWNGGIEVSRKAIKSALTEGDNVAVMSDGIAGMFAADAGMRTGKEVIVLKKRRGLVRIALETGSPLVPFVCLGNTKACLPATDRFGIMEALSRMLGASFIWPAGRWGLPIPYRTPITVVIGAPLLSPCSEPIPSPPEAMVDAMHEQLMSEVSAMYYRWRNVAGYAGVELEII